MHKHWFGSFRKSRYWSFACASTSDILKLFEYFSILEPFLTHSVCLGCILVVMCAPGGMTAVEAVARQGGGSVRDHAMRFIQSFWQTSVWTLTRMFQDREERTTKDAWNVKMTIKNISVSILKC